MDSGQNQVGQLGLGDRVNRGDGSGAMGDALPYVDLGSDWEAKGIWGGSGHFCALLHSNKIKCWGYNQYGQLGIESISTPRGSNPSHMGDNLQETDVGLESDE